MALFQQTVLKKYIESLDSNKIDQQWEKFKSIFHNVEKQNNIRNSKEEQFQEGFLRELFVGVLGYTINPDENFNLLTELKNVANSKKADGAILIDGKAVAVIELKGTETTDLNKIEVQAFGYKNNQHNCTYVITSNFEKIRFYIENTIQQEEFNLFTLNKERFQLLYTCLSWESISKNIPIQILNESVSKENKITKDLYKDYSEFKRELFSSLVGLNPQYDKLLLFKKSQKLLDRFLFIFFAEDTSLLPTNLIFRINTEWQNLVASRVPVSLYDRYKMYFNDLNQGAKVTLPAFGKKTGEAITAEFEIFAYNGGLFHPDEILDTIKIDDTLLYNYTQKMSHYNFDSDVDVNILGHIFENSLNEIDEIKSEIEGNVLDKTKTRRKKDGVFYTPKYITKYIVDNTVGKLCSEKKIEIQLQDEDYVTDKKLQTKTKKALLDKLTDYRSWLLQLTICDPACGSGAFLNQALEFLIAEHRYIDELQAKLMGDAMILSDIENSILENNIYGVDLNDESVEIAKLSLWLRTAQKGRKLNSLNNNIKCGNSLIDDIEVAGDKAFSWDKEFPDVFAKGGFDVVIGNPPYVRQELFKEIKPFLEKHYLCYNSVADLYTYFIEKGILLFKKEGLFSFILPNKFIKATYGMEIRKVMLSESNLELLVDFDDYPIFEDATTYPIIFTLNKKKEGNDFFDYSEINKRDITIDPITLINVKKRKIALKSLNENNWNFSSNKESKLIEKIKKKSISLSKYVNGKINRGVLTGKNEVFIFDDVFKNHLIKKNAEIELIKPILLGSSIKRYNINFSNDYLLFTRRGIEIDNYPVIKDYLQQFYDELRPRNNGEIKGRKAGTYKWFEIQDNVAYYEDFESPKIVYPRTNNQCNFQLDLNGYYLSDNNFYIKSESKTLLGILNSKLIYFYLKSICTTLQGGYYDFRRDKIDTIPLPEKLSFNKKIEEFVSLQISYNESLNNYIKKFSSYFTSQYKIVKLSGKLEKWYDLEFVDFIKELNKAIKIVKGTPLTKKDEFEWIDLFEENKQKALSLKSEIDKTDKEIDHMVYALYELTEEEIKIVEG